MSGWHRAAGPESARRWLRPARAQRRARRSSTNDRARRALVAGVAGTLGLLQLPLLAGASGAAERQAPAGTLRAAVPLRAAVRLLGANHGSARQRSLASTVSRLLATHPVPFEPASGGSYTATIGTGLTASMSPSGVTLRLPRERRLRLALTGLSRGGGPVLELRASRLVERAGARASRDAVAAGEAGHTATSLSEDLGPLVESYRSVPGGVEQSFVVGRRPAGHGSQLALVMRAAGAVRVAASRAGSLDLEVSDGTGRPVSVSYAGLRAVDARGRHLAARFAVVGDTVRILVDDARATYPLEIDPTYSSGQPLADGASAIAFSDNGDVALVGSDFAEPVTTGGSVTPGAAFLMHWNGSSWSSITLSDETISANCSGPECGYPNWDTGDEYGYSVALSADGLYAAVGAPGAYGGSAGYGAVFVYAVTLDRDTPVATLTSLLGENTNGSDRFGTSVAVTDTAAGGAGTNPEVVVGAPHTSYYYTSGGTYVPIGSASTGALFVYNDPPLLNYGNGNLEADGGGSALYDSSAGAGGEQLGTSVAIDAAGDLIVAGAPDYSSAGGSPEQGAVYAFAGESAPPDLVATGAATGDMLGESVSVTRAGSEVAAGEPMAATGVTPAPAGEVQVLDPASSWSSTVVSPASPVAGEAYGTSVALSDDGQTLLAGAPYDDYYTRTSAFFESTNDATPGYAYVEQALGGSFAAPIEQSLAPIGSNGEYFGAAVGLDGNASVVAVGAPNDYNSTYFNGYEPGNSYFYGTPAPLVPDVQLVHPDSGPASPGQSGAIAIFGSGFSGASAVYFGSTSASFSTSNDTSIDATPPLHGVGTVDVTVVGPGGTSSVNPDDEYTYATPPAVTSVSPTAGPADQVTPITVDGSGFTGATEVSFVCASTVGNTCGGARYNVLAGQLTVVSDGEITLDAPDDSELEISTGGTFDVIVDGVGGGSATSSADEFTLVVPEIPKVTAVSPVEGPAGQHTPIAIDGSGFTGATGIDFYCRTDSTGCSDDPLPYDFSSGQFSVVSDGVITLDAPDDSDLGITGGGTFDIVVTTPGGSSARSSADEFTLAFAPVVQSIGDAGFPNGGPTETYQAGGWEVPVTGSGFTNATKVYFGSVPAEAFTVESDTGLLAVAPPGTGTVDVTVTTPAGTSATGPDDQVTYFAPPILDSLSPAVVSPAGGAVVTLTGSGFLGLPTTGGAVYLVGYTAQPIEVAGTDYSVQSDTSMTLTMPALPRGALSALGAIVLSDGGYPSDSASNDALSSSDEVRYGAVVDGLSPAAGPLAGGNEVVIEGTGLTDAEQVDFGTNAAPEFQVLSDDEIEAVAPAGSAGQADVEVLTPSGSSSTLVSGENVYSYLGAPVVDSVAPASAAFESTVTITGSGFAATTRVDFTGAGGADYHAAGFTVVSGNELQAVVPDGTGSVDILVTNPGGTSTATVADQFSFDPPTSSPLAGAGSPPAASSAPPGRAGVPGGAGPAVGGPPTAAASGGVGQAQAVGSAVLDTSTTRGRGVLSVELRCPAGRACAGRAVLVLTSVGSSNASISRSLVLAVARFRIAAGRRARLSWHLSATALRQLARSSRGRLVLDLRDGDVVSSRLLALRRLSVR